jgi:hypothetical protein
MANIKYGLAFEGKRDIIPLEILIKRILEPYNFVPIFSKEVTPHTGLMGYISLYIKNFFDEGEPIDAAIFVTDQDKQTKNVRTKIRSIISQINRTYYDVSIIGVPDPHFEAWLLADEDFVKSYFTLPNNRNLPNINNSPKNTLEYLVRHMPEPRVPLFQAYEDLANSSNLQTIIASKHDFKRFVDDLISICRLLNN